LQLPGLSRPVIPELTPDEAGPAGVAGYTAAGCMVLGAVCQAWRTRPVHSLPAVAREDVRRQTEGKHFVTDRIGRGNIWEIPLA
jgi:hypothetical protein